MQKPASIADINARLDPIHAEVKDKAKTEQEARDIYLRHGLHPDDAAMFARVHAADLAAE